MCIFSLLVIATVGFGGTFRKSAHLSPDRLLAQKIDTYIQSYGDFNGAVLVTRNGKIIICQGYGYANYELEIPNAPQTKFRIASLTKSFTAVAAMHLQERNLLRVQDSLAKYIPNYPDGEKITIHHLLTHTSGIPNYYSHFSDVAHCINLEEMISAIKKWPLEFQAGSRYRYSNTGYLLLAYIIEKASGESYENFLYENIFKPLGMNSTGHVNSKVAIKNHALGYAKESDKIATAPPINAPITLLGNGDLYSCLEDMLLWDQALDTEKIVSLQTLNCMFTPHVITSNSSKRAHGYGWFIDEFLNKRIVEYSGALRGFLSKHVKFIDDKITIIVLSNLENQEEFCKICDDIPAIIFDQPLNTFKS